MSGTYVLFAASFRKAAAFSLIELLLVMGVMTLLMGVAVPAVSSLAKGSQMNQALSDVAGMLEMARQHATAQNTYVWVAFNDEAASQGADEQVRVAVLVSKSGADLSTWGSDDTTASAASTQLIVKPRTFNQVKLSDATVFKSQITDLPAADASSLGAASFTIKVPGRQNEIFTKAIQFTPTGEARTGSGMTGIVDLGLQPTHGHALNAQNVAVVRVNGLTGQTRIYRP
jgi:Tfp pilus assembly protein FimT